MDPIFKKRLIYSIIIFVLIFIGLFLFNIRHHGKFEVKIQVAPSKSSVVIDNFEVDSRRIYLPPGKYKFEASFRDFEPDKKEVLINGNTVVKLSPRPVSDSALDYLATDYASQKEIENFGGDKATKDGAASTYKYAVFDSFPYIDTYFSIYPGAPSDSRAGDFKMALHVYADTPQARILAARKIVELGVDTSQVEIVFETLQNPFIRSSE